MSEISNQREWQAAFGLDAANLLSVAFGGSPDDPATVAILRTVRDRLTQVLDAIAERRARQVTPKLDLETEDT